MTKAPSPRNPSSGAPVRRADALPVVLVPGLLTSPRLYGPQLPMLWQSGPTVIADNTRDDSMAAIASSILAAAPPRFALVGLSMGGYISFEIMRQAPGRVAKLALLNTSARPDTSEQTERRRGHSPRRRPAVSTRFPANSSRCSSIPITWASRSSGRSRG